MRDLVEGKELTGGLALGCGQDVGPGHLSSIPKGTEQILWAPAEMQGKCLRVELSNTGTASRSCVSSKATAAPQGSHPQTPPCGAQLPVLLDALLPPHMEASYLAHHCSQAGLEMLISSGHIRRGQVERQAQAQRKSDSATLFQQQPCCQPKAQLKGTARAKVKAFAGSRNWRQGWIRGRKIKPQKWQLAAKLANTG